MIDSVQSEAQRDSITESPEADLQKIEDKVVNISESDKKTVDSLKNSWEIGNMLIVANTHNWSNGQWLYFMNKVSENKKSEHLNRYREAFKFYDFKDNLISRQWQIFSQNID